MIQKEFDGLADTRKALETRSTDRHRTKGYRAGLPSTVSLRSRRRAWCFRLDGADETAYFSIKGSPPMTRAPRVLSPHTE